MKSLEKNSEYSIAAARHSFSILFLIGLLGFIYYFANPYMTWASAAYFLMIVGIFQTKSRARHFTLMSVAVGMDLTLVLFLEFTRNAVQTAMSMKLSPLQQLHILFSLMALLFYLPTIYFGWQTYSQQKPFSKIHRRIGMTAFFLRTAGFFLMFSMLSR